jgi:hypothetical protein
MGGCTVERRPRAARRPLRYEFVVRGELDARLAAAFDGMTPHAADGRTRLVGTVLDQAHLHGLLARAHGLGLELLSVNPLVEDDPPAGAGHGTGPSAQRPG